MKKNDLSAVEISENRILNYDLVGLVPNVLICQMENQECHFLHQEFFLEIASSLKKLGEPKVNVSRFLGFLGSHQ